MTDILGYIAALFIGLSLGLIGGGGSVLTIPILVYLMGVPPVLATAYSLFIVGVVALVGIIQKIAKNQIDMPSAIVFAIPSMGAIYIVRRYAIPFVPDPLLTLGGYEITKGAVIMLFFSIIMMWAAWAMIRPIKKRQSPFFIKNRLSVIALEGVLVGVVAGVVGAGGGFIIVPALVLIARLEIKKAVGTSLFIIALNSAVGFVGDLQVGRPIEWIFVLSFTGIAVIGVLLGNHVSHFVSGAKLKVGFGWLLIILAFYIAVSELIIM